MRAVGVLPWVAVPNVDADGIAAADADADAGGNTVNVDGMAVDDGIADVDDVAAGQCHARLVGPRRPTGVPRPRHAAVGRAVVAAALGRHRHFPSRAPPPPPPPPY